MTSDQTKSPTLKLERRPVRNELLRSAALISIAMLGLGGCGLVGDKGPLETPPPQMRLITESQYRHTIADLFGDEIEVVGRFEHAPEVDRLGAIGASQMSISSRGYERYYEMAGSISDQLVRDENWSNLMPCEAEATEAFDSGCAEQIVAHYGERILRRPLAPEGKARWVSEIEKSTSELNDFKSAVGLALQGMLAAPEFIFIVDTTESDPKSDGLRLTAHAKAHRLSYFLWNSIPDEELLSTAKSGELHDKKVLKAQVDRMLASERLSVGAMAFFEDFLDLDAFETLEKDKLIYPAFNKRAANDAREQVLRFLDEKLISQEAAYPEIFTAKDTFITRNLGMIYRAPVRAQDGWEPYAFPQDDPRAGLLSHVGFSALHSHPGRSSATLRGIAIRELLLCQTVEPAPAAVSFTVVQDTDNPEFRTARERLTQHRTDPSCKSCHEFIDPVGLAMENFDGSGAFRELENGAEIETAGEIDGYLFGSLEEMQRTIAEHPATPACVVEKLQKYALGRRPVGAERAWRVRLEEAFSKRGYKVPALMKDIVLSNEFYAVGKPVRSENLQTADTGLSGGES